MKKIYTLILLVSTTYFANAQYTLTSASNPVIGDLEKTWTADTLTPTGLYPIGGVNKIWNYTGITISPTVTAKTTSYVAVNTAPNASSYPLANIASTSDGLEFSMSRNTTTSSINYGTTNSTLAMVYSNPQQINLPIYYGTFSTDTYSTSYISNSVTTTEMGTVSVSGDATGTLNMPGSKTYNNVLRLKITFSVVQNSGSNGSFTVNADGYSYVNASSKFTILSISTNSYVYTNGTITVTGTGKNVTVGDMVFVGVKENNQVKNFNIFPNPSHNKEISIQFSPDLDEKYELTIYNSLGQEVKKQNFDTFSVGDRTERIQIDDFNTGLYYVKLRSNKHESIQKLIVD